MNGRLQHRKICDVFKRFLHQKKTAQSETRRNESLREVFSENARKRQSFAMNIFTSNKSTTTTGLFGVEELGRPEGFSELQTRCISNCEKLVDEATSSNRERVLAKVFDDLSDELCRVADLAEFIRIAHPDPTFVEASTKTCLAINDLVEQLNTNVKLFENLEKVCREGDIFEESDVDRNVAKLFLHDFQQSGIQLNEELRKDVVNLNGQILRLQQQFLNESQSSQRTVRMKNIPKNVRSHFLHPLSYIKPYHKREGDDNVVISLNSPNTFSNDESIRETAYRLFYAPDEKQEETLSALINSRHALSNLCSFPSYAHRALQQSLASNPENVKKFLSTLNFELSSRLTHCDLRVFSEVKRKMGAGDGQVQMWDINYLTRVIKDSVMKSGNCEKISREFRNFFPLNSVMEGLSDLLNSLFGITLVPCNSTLTDGEVWHSDVVKLGVIDGDGSLLGHIYCDFFERPGKFGGDFHSTIRGGREINETEYQNPIVVLHMNLSRKRGCNGPILLSHSTLKTLFHEMGHALHSMFARTKYQHVTGTRCSTDFAEVPSTLMEYFADDPRVLHKLSSHFERPDLKLEESDLKEYIHSSKVCQLSDIHKQVLFSSIDQLFHSGPLPDNSKHTSSWINSSTQIYHPFPIINEDIAYQHRFSHLTGYAAKFYSYLMARSVASLIYQQYFMDDPFNGESGRKYRFDCLSHGGAIPSKILVNSLLGREIDVNDMSKALLTELDDTCIQNTLNVLKLF